MDRYFNLDGKLLPEGQAAIHPDSWSFRYGYGLFETMLVRAGAIQRAQLHWERLEAGMRLLKMPLPENYREHFESEINRTLEVNDLSESCRLRLQVFAGKGSFLNNGTSGLSFLIEVHEWKEPDVDAGFKIGFSDVQKHSGAYAHLKSCNALVFVLAGREAQIKNLDDVLLINQHGRIVESSIANIFWIENGVIYTPPLSEGCVAGTFRRYLMETLPEKGFQLKTGLLNKTRLLEAEGIFLTNAIRGVTSVKEVENQAFPTLTVEKIQSLL